MVAREDDGGAGPRGGGRVATDGTDDSAAVADVRDNELAATQQRDNESRCAVAPLDVPGRGHVQDLAVCLE